MYLIDLLNCEYKFKLCPLLFNNTWINELSLDGLTNTFYKKNILEFENQTFNSLNSTIFLINIYKSENVDLDLNFLNPSVFKYLNEIYLFSFEKSLFFLIFDCVS